MQSEGIKFKYSDPDLNASLRLELFSGNTIRVLRFF